MFCIDKQIGETPLEALDRFRQNNPTYQDARLSYAGRLDPMADGALLILEGNENDRREEFLGLDKSYDFEILFGASTDTFDLMGLVQQVESSQTFNRKQVQDHLDTFIGDWDMIYPPYSSQTVDGTPLWQLARAGEIDDIALPEKRVEIYKLACKEIVSISSADVLSQVKKRVGKVSGDFRQEKIIRVWQDNLAGLDSTFQLAQCRIDCTAGTYVRRLAQEVGVQLNSPALAFSITRLKVGDYCS